METLASTEGERLGVMSSVGCSSANTSQRFSETPNSNALLVECSRKTLSCIGGFRSVLREPVYFTAPAPTNSHLSFVHSYTRGSSAGLIRASDGSHVASGSFGVGASAKTRRRVGSKGMRRV